MNIRYEAKFKRDLQNIRDKALLKRVKQTIGEVKNADDAGQLTKIKKLKGFATYYRFRIGNYRIGVEIKGDEIIFVRFLHRSEIYRFFP